MENYLKIVMKFFVKNIFAYFLLFGVIYYMGVVTFKFVFGFILDFLKFMKLLLREFVLQTGPRINIVTVKEALTMQLRQWVRKGKSESGGRRGILERERE